MVAGKNLSLGHIIASKEQNLGHCLMETEAVVAVRQDAVYL